MSGQYEIHEYCGGLLATNAYLLQGSEGSVLIDAPDGTAGWLKSIDVRPDYLLLTHFHFDHVYRVAGVLDWAGSECKVSAFAPEITSDLTLADFFKFTGSSFEVVPFEIDEILENVSSVQVVGQDLEVIHVPGHSPDSVCFFQRANRQLFGGDVLMAGGVGRTDFPHGDGNLLASGVRDKILPLGDDVRVFPGHGPETTIGAERGMLQMLLGV